MAESPLERRVSLWTDGSSSKDNINSGKKEFELRVGKLARSLRQKMLVKSDDLRHVCNGVLGKSGKAGR